MFIFREGSLVGLTSDFCDLFVGFGYFPKPCGFCQMPFNDDPQECITVILLYRKILSLCPSITYGTITVAQIPRCAQTGVNSSKRS